MIRKVFVDMCMREYIIVAKFVEFIAKTNDCMIKIYTRKKYHKNICKNGDVEYTIFQDDIITKWTESISLNVFLNGSLK